MKEDDIPSVHPLSDDGLYPSLAAQLPQEAPIMADESGTRPDTSKVIVLMPADMHTTLKELAEFHDLTMSQAVRRAVRRWIQENATATPEAIAQ